MIGHNALHFHLMTKPMFVLMVIRSHTFSRAWRWQQVFQAISSDWFIGLSVSLVIGQSYYLKMYFENHSIIPRFVL